MSGRSLLLMVVVEVVLVLFSVKLDTGDRLPRSTTTMLSFVEPPAPPPPLRLHAGTDPPRKIVDVEPAYPERARTARVQGVVILEVVIDARGRVGAIRVVRSIPMLDEAAVAAVRRWQFAPTLSNGEAVPIVMTVTVSFQLSR